MTTRPMKGKNMLFCVLLCDGRFGLGDEMVSFGIDGGGG